MWLVSFRKRSDAETQTQEGGSHRTPEAHVEALQLQVKECQEFSTVPRIQEETEGLSFAECGSGHTLISDF